MTFLTVDVAASSPIALAAAVGAYGRVVERLLQPDTLTITA